MARQTWAYLGAGEVKMREFGSAAPMILIGNCSVLQFTAEIDSKELRDFRRPGGGVYAKVDRMSSVSINLTVHDVDGANLARASNGAATNVVTGSQSPESIVAFKGGTIPLLYPPDTITKVEPAGGGTAYTVGDDYAMTPGGIYIVPSTDGGSISDASDAETPNVDVTYTYGALQVVEALVSSGKVYEMLFEGLNEAESDAAVIVHAYRVKFGPAQSIDFIGDDFAGLELVGTSLPNLDITTPGKSQYWKASLVV